VGLNLGWIFRFNFGMRNLFSPVAVGTLIKYHISVRAIDGFVYMISSNVLGLDKTKTNLFGREGLELFFIFLAASCLAAIF